MAAIPILGIAAIVGIGVALTHTSHRAEAPASETPSAPPPASAVAQVAAERVSDRAGADELSQATQGGPDALQALASKYPKDPSILLALGGAWVHQKEPEKAVAAIGNALELDGKVAADERTASVLWMTAQNKKSSAAAFDLLTGPMGEKGRSILSDLVSTPNVRAAVKDEARRALAKSDSKSGR